MIQDRRPLMFFENKRNVANPTVVCKYCSKLARGGKPECVDHLSKRPYVATLMAEMLQHEKEERRVEKQGSRAVKLDGLHVSEILIELRMHGPKTVGGLVRNTQFSEVVVRACLQKMQRAKMVKIYQDMCGRPVAVLDQS